MSDSVNHPKHYTAGKFEVIEVIEDWKLNFHRGNAVKYIARAGKKNDELEDLKKARWYLDREIVRLTIKPHDQVKDLDTGEVGYVFHTNEEGKIVVSFPDGTRPAQRLVKL